MTEFLFISHINFSPSSFATIIHRIETEPEFGLFTQQNVTPVHVQNLKRQAN